MTPISLSLSFQIFVSCFLLLSFIVWGWNFFLHSQDNSLSFLSPPSPPPFFCLLCHLHLRTLFPSRIFCPRIGMAKQTIRKVWRRKKLFSFSSTAKTAVKQNGHRRRHSKSGLVWAAFSAVQPQGNSAFGYKLIYGGLFLRPALEHLDDLPHLWSLVL